MTKKRRRDGWPFTWCRSTLKTMAPWFNVVQKKSMGSDSLLSHLVFSKLLLKLPGQWFHGAELWLDMKSTVRAPCGSAHVRMQSVTDKYMGQDLQIHMLLGVTCKWGSSDSYPKGTYLKIFATEAHGNTRKKNTLLIVYFRIFPCNSVCFRG